MELKGRTIGWGLCGSHHSLAGVLPYMRTLVEEGAEVVPVFSFAVATTATEYGTPEDWARRVRGITGREPIRTIAGAEPLGPKVPLDAFVIAPCTGNTLAKLACAITDTPVLMAAKATLRNGRPVVLAVSTNDALGNNARNLGLLLNAKGVFFVPFGQDNPEAKPNSLVADVRLILDTLRAALAGRQLQPLLRVYTKGRDG